MGSKAKRDYIWSSIFSWFIQFRMRNGKFFTEKKLFIHRQFLKFIFPKENSFFALLFRVGAKICPIPGNDFYDLRNIWRQDSYLYENKKDEFFTTG